MDRRRSSLGAIFAALTILCSLPAIANSEELGLSKDVAMASAITESRRQVIMAANVPLTDAEGAKFWPLYRDYRNDVAKINERVIELIKDYAQHSESLTDAQAKSITNGMLDTKKQRLALMSKYIPKYAKIVGNVKTARVMQIESKLDALVDLGIAQTVPLVQP